MLEIISWNFIFISKYEFQVVKKKAWQQNHIWLQTSDKISLRSVGKQIVAMSETVDQGDTGTGTKMKHKIL